MIVSMLVPQHILSAVPLGEYLVRQSTSGSFELHYPAQLQRMAQEIEKLLEASAPDIARQLGVESIKPIRVFLAADDGTYRMLNRGLIPEWGAAFSDLGAQVLGINVDMVLRSPRPLTVVVRHELSHLLFSQRVGPVRAPVWFIEGLAMVQANEWSFSDEWRLMTLAGRRDLPYLETLSGQFPRPSNEASIAYGISYLAVEELLRGRPDAIMTLTAFLRDTGDFDRAFMSTFGQTVYDFASRLYVSVDRRYRTPGVILNATPYWLALAILFVGVYAIKRVQTRRKLEQWEEDEERRSRFWY
jgi:hypothetical protein